MIFNSKLVNIAKILGILMLFLGFVFYGIRTVDDMNGPEPGDPKSIRDYNDFNVFFGAGEKLFAGKEIYFEPTSPEGRYFLFPPIFAFYMSLLTKLGLRGAAVYWYLANLFMVIMSAYLIASIMAKERSTRVTLILLGLFLTGRFIDSDFGNGNVNCHVLFFLASGLWCLAKKRGFWAGAAVAIASLIKVTSIIFMVYFVWKFMVSWLSNTKTPLHEETSQHYIPHLSWGRVITGMLVTLFLFTAVVPTLFLGWNKNSQLHQNFFTSMVSPYLKVSSHPEKYWDSGYSLKVLLLRYLTERATPPWKKQQPLQINLTRLQEKAVWQLFLLIAIIMVAISLLAWRSNIGNHLSDSQRIFLIALEMGTLLALMIIISPLSRKAHFVVLLIPVITFLRTGFKPRMPYLQKFRKLLVGSAVAVGVIGMGSSKDIVGKHVFNVLDAHCILLWAPIILWTSGIIVLLSLYTRGDKAIDINGKT